MKNRITLNLIFLLFTITVFGQNYELKDFQIDSVPTKQNQWKISNSKKHWTISKINDSIKITNYDFNYFKGDKLPFEIKDVIKKLNTQYYIRAVKKVDDGFLIGLNGGEFGGGLWFLSKDGQSSYEIASYKRVRQIFEYNDKIYVLEGLAHMGVNYGNLLELKKEESWVINKIFNLPDAPNFAIFKNDIVLIITSEYILTFNEYNKLIKTLKVPFYMGSLYPSSAITDKNDIYLAMREGVLKVSLFEYNPEYTWFVKNKE